MSHKEQCVVGEGCPNDWGTGKKDKNAFECYKKAAEQGNAYAQHNLANCYSFGEGTEQDYAKAFEWYKKAAEQGVSEAQYNLGVC
ncbi:MAG: sel1 repeat family protein, partial [Treponemataceae bacterium]|nr:sel1 repeat family protein [Treponemataceae bacterium]